MRGTAYSETLHRGRGSPPFPLLVGVLGSALSLGAGCKDEYPLAPSFCDDWCRATLRSGCDDAPDQCVSECELTKASGECLALQEDLMRCYERADDSAFVCAGRRFNQEPRVLPEVCRSERDTLFECVAPGMETCLDVCRSAQQDQLAQVKDSATGLYDFRSLRGDAGAGPPCPVLDQPCENICWSLFAFSSVGLEQQGVEQPDAATQSQLVEANQCFQALALMCLLGEQLPGGGDIGGDADAGAGVPGGPALDCRLPDLGDDR
jgi:hypothetical protein